MVLCRVYGMFCAVFVACFVALIGRVLWPMKRVVLRTVMGQNSVYWRSHELSGTLLGVVWRNYMEPARYCVVRLRNFSSWVRNCIGFGAIA